MKNLFDTATVAEVKARVTQLGNRNTRQWGRMNASQALAHCSRAFELALGERRPPRMPAGRVFGWLLKRLALGNDAPMRRNTPTLGELVVLDERDLDTERQRLLALIDRFAAGGAAACTTHPHPFFGRLTPQQWAIYEYKHLDHHLRQFAA